MNKRLKKFEDAMGRCVDLANDLHKVKGETVVCSYCGKLMPKSEAGVIYSIETNTLTYNHDECFNRFEHVSDEMPIPKEVPNAPRIS